MEKSFKSVDILGVRVDNVDMDQSVNIVEDWLERSGKHYIVTPNPEFIMAAQEDEEFKKILNEADLAIPDGSRLGWASRMLEETLLWKKLLLLPFFLFPSGVVIQFNIVAGVDLMEALCKEAADKGFTVGLLGGQVSVARKTGECLQKKYKNLKIVYAESGPGVNKEGEEISVPSSDKYRKLKADILFVGFGQVKQEKWISRNLDKIPVKVAMGVGGSFDYLSGSVMRAPIFIRLLGLEWLFRLILQPWRIKRQIKLLKFITLLLFKT